MSISKHTDVTILKVKTDYIITETYKSTPTYSTHTQLTTTAEVQTVIRDESQSPNPAMNSLWEFMLQFTQMRQSN